MSARPHSGALKAQAHATCPPRTSGRSRDSVRQTRARLAGAGGAPPSQPQVLVRRACHADPAASGAPRARLLARDGPLDADELATGRPGELERGANSGSIFGQRVGLQCPATRGKRANPR